MIVPPDSLGIADVTAQRRVAGLATPQALQRLTTTDLQQRGVTDIADALRRFSGVNLRDYGGAGGLKTVSVRGLRLVIRPLATTDSLSQTRDKDRLTLDSSVPTAWATFVAKHG